jgi:glutathione S-transferase
MADVKIYGIAISMYTRSARWCCEEKGVSHELVSLELGSARHRELHPFSKIPILEHGNFRVRETTAICRYIDEAFPGPALQPTDVKQRAEMEQWMGYVNSYFYPDLATNYALQYILPSMQGTEPDRNAIEAGVPNLARSLRFIDAGYQRGDHLVGTSLSFADMLLLPILTTVVLFPEAQKVLGDCPNLQRILKVYGARPAFQRIQPPPAA